MSMLESSVNYVKRGYSVIPLQPKGKRPIVEWKQYQGRYASSSELSKWFKGTNNNIGIVTGKISGITVIDCDSQEAEDLAKRLGLPMTYTVKTGRGRHYYFEYSEGSRNFQKRDDLRGIDLRSDGGYVVAPPSLHPNGSKYEVEAAMPLSSLPGWPIASKSQKVPLRTLYGGAATGSRNDTLARLAGVIVKLAPVEDVIAIAQGWNMLNYPPLTPMEVERTVMSIYKAEKRKVCDDHQKEIMMVGDIDAEIDRLYQFGITAGVSTGWDSMDDYYTVKPGQWTLVTGIPGSGKSEILDSIMMNMAIEKDWKFGLFSAETLPLERHFASLAEKYVGRPFKIGPTDRIRDVDLRAAKEFIGDKFFFIMPNENKITVDHILELGHDLVSQHKINGMVIDPWNEIDQTRPKAMTETEYISDKLSKIRRFARKNNIHIWVVAHPMKLRKDLNGDYPVPTPYDVSGSAHWRNKADNALSIWRDFNREDGQIDVHIQKVRFKEIGKVGKVPLYFNKITGRYSCERFI